MGAESGLIPKLDEEAPSSSLFQGRPYLKEWDK